MKVVLFCGGLGSRLREHSETVPKPLVDIGPRPIIWHLMRYYAHFGHKEFILCLGYKGDMLKDYFLNYDDCRSNDFTIDGPERKIEVTHKDIDDWKITFVDTGMHSNLGMRLRAVQQYLAGEEMFLANYSDGLSDLPLNDYIEQFRKSDSVASFLSVRPFSTYHVVQADEDSRVTGIVSVKDSNVWVNGGFFALRPQIFDYMQDGEELVEEPFQRLIADGKLMTQKYVGFWEAMDTYKDWKNLEDMYHSGQRPWVMHSNKPEDRTVRPRAKLRAM